MFDATITIRVRVEEIDRSPEALEALDNLVSVMLVQGEDGLYLAGSPEIETYEVDGEEVENLHLSSLVFDAPIVTVNR